MKRVYLSLGSNVGDRLAHLRKALNLLTAEGVSVSQVSSFYKTEPVDVPSQPWFANCVAEAGTDLMPLQLLRRCQAVERALGRRPGVVKGPRRIDIDILLYENVVVRTPNLIIPHQRLEARRFVLVPLQEVAGHARHPVTRRTVEEMLHDTPDHSQVIKFKDLFPALP